MELCKLEGIIPAIESAHAVAYAFKKAKEMPFLPFPVTPEAAGTDIIELGIPFSDPVADGPVIQAASYEAILGGANLEKTFTCMKEMRTDGVQIPVVFMMYYNTVLHYGVEKFVKECNACGVDGLIIPDLPLEEQEELQTQLQKEDGTILIQLVSPVSKDRVPKIPS